MLKIIYTSEPFYSDLGLNDTATKELTMSFDEESSSVEIIAQIIKLLEFMGYSKQTKTQWINMVEDLSWDGYLIDDQEKESQEN